MTVPFAFSGTNYGATLLTRPDTNGWVDRPILAYDGNHVPIYPFLREYELHWDFIEPEAFQQLRQIYVAVSTGSMVAFLPQYAGTIDADNFDLCFVPYSGITVTEPTYKSFFNGYYQDVELLVVGIMQA